MILQKWCKLQSHSKKLWGKNNSYVSNLKTFTYIMTCSNSIQGNNKHLVKLIQYGASRVAQWVLGSRPGSVVTGHDRKVRGATHNWPSVVRVREGLAGRDILVSSRTSDSYGGPGAVRANQGARCFLRHIGAAGFRVGCALC